MPSGASVVRASVAVLLDQPFGVVAGGEGADGVSDVVDGLEDTSVHDLLLEGSEQALDDAIIRYEIGGASWSGCSRKGAGDMVSPSGTRGAGSTKVRCGATIRMRIARQSG